ncbi:Phytolongin Phyl2.2 [Linum grandiflorum]
MISNPDLILYACIAKGSTILAEYASPSDPAIVDIAQKCVEVSPPHHSAFSHTVKKKTYAFSIEGPFVYFAIFHKDLARLESSWFVDRVKVSFLDLLASKSVKDFDALTSLCFQSDFYPLFREILALDLDLADSLTGSSKDSRNPSLDSNKEKTVTRPLLNKSGKALTKKKKSRSSESPGGGEEKSEHSRGLNGGGMMENGSSGHNKEFSVAMTSKSGGVYMAESKQKAKQMWKKHVWVVLTLDLVVCAVLFFVWLWVCRGFTCIDG